MRSRRQYESLKNTKWNTRGKEWTNKVEKGRK
jgi:hypothetical protein